MFGTPGSAPAFGATGAASSPSPFGSLAPSSTPSLFGSSTSPNTTGGLFGQSQAYGGSLLGQPATGGSLLGQPVGGLFSQPATGAGLLGQAPTGGGLFGQPSTGASLLGQPVTGGGMFGQPASGGSLFSQPGTGGGLFGQSLAGGGLFGPSPAGGSMFGQSATGGSLFGQPQGQPSLFSPPLGGGAQLGASQAGVPGQLSGGLFGGGQLLTQMAPVAPLVINAPDKDVQGVLDAYNENFNNPQYRFRHLFLSVVDPSQRQRPAAVSDLLWSEAMNQIAAVDSELRDKLWPDLAQGFKDLSHRLKLQDEAIASDAERLRGTEANVRQLQQHFEGDTGPWIERLRQKEQELQRRLLHVMRLVEALEARTHIGRPLSRGEVQLAEKLRGLAQQLQSASADLPRRVSSLLSTSRLTASSSLGSSGAAFPARRIEDRSMADMHRVLFQKTEAIKSLAAVLSRDLRDMNIIASNSAQPSLPAPGHGHITTASQAGAGVWGGGGGGSSGLLGSGGLVLGMRTPGRLAQ